MTKNIITNIYVKRYIGVKKYNKTYTSALVEFTTDTPYYDIECIYVARYQHGEVNNIAYADSVRINPGSLMHLEGSGKYSFSTDMLGYGESTKSVTYTIRVTLCTKNGFFLSDVLTLTTPDGMYM